MGAAREALVGLVGLTELVVDALFFLPWYSQVRIESVEVKRWLRVSNPELPLPRSDELQWKGSALPPALLPPGCQQHKVDLLRKGRARFDVWAALSTDGPPRLTPPRPGLNQARLEAEVRLFLAEPPLSINGGKSAQHRHWSSTWGSYPQGEWVMERHACAHLRAPLFERSILAEAQLVAPRFIELLYRLQHNDVVDITASGADGWVSWWHDKRWSQRARVPWGADGDTHIASWLRLPNEPA